MQIVVNGNLKQFEASEMTVAELVNELQFVGKRIAIECNGAIVPKSQYAQSIIKDGDQLEVVGAVGGG